MIFFVKQNVCILNIGISTGIYFTISVEKANHTRKHFRCIDAQGNEIMYINIALR